MTRTKKDIVNEVAKLTGFTQREVGAIVNSFLNVISKTLLADNRIELRGFGVFIRKHRNPKQARNPKTGKSVMVPERFVPVFKPSKILKERLK
ncbi:MAG: HU family DNA-binding protein [bacterium]|nr:HU family DNA-binding protein [bacterium]